MFRRGRFVILAVSAFAVVALVITYALVAGFSGAWQVGLQMVNTLAPPRTLQFYAPQFVQAICHQFEISLEDAFCSNPTEQNTFTLEDALERWFPLGRATYNDIMPYMQNVPADGDCVGGEYPGEEDRPVYSCPPPQTCSGSPRCRFTVQPRFRIRVEFSRETAVIRGFGVQAPPAIYGGGRSPTPTLDTTIYSPQDQDPD